MSRDPSTKRRTKATDEIEALLRDDAPSEVAPGTGRVTRDVTATLRRDVALRRREGLRVGGMFDDEGRVPRWYLAAAMVGIAVLAGWMVFGRGPSGATAPPQIAQGAGAARGEGVSVVAETAMEVSPRDLLALIVEPQNARLEREARALAGAAERLAQRVIGGIPAELVVRRAPEPESDT